MVSTRMLIHKPKELSWEQAAGIPEVRDLISHHLEILTSGLYVFEEAYTHVDNDELLLDLDHSVASTLLHWRVQTRPIYPMACWRLLGLYCWYSTS